jgi:hypothetical protein
MDERKPFNDLVRKLYILIQEGQMTAEVAKAMMLLAVDGKHPWARPPTADELVIYAPSIHVVLGDLERRREELKPLARQVLNEMREHPLRAVIV